MCCNVSSRLQHVLPCVCSCCSAYRALVWVSYSLCTASRRLRDRCMACAYGVICVSEIAAFDYINRCTAGFCVGVPCALCAACFAGDAYVYCVTDDAAAAAAAEGVYAAA